VKMMDVNHLLVQSIIVPLLFSPIIFALGKALKRNVGWITLLPLLYSASCLLIPSYLIYIHGESLLASYRWAPLLGSDFALLLDGISAPVALTIVILAAIICVYSISYMEERALGAYFALYLLFVSGMLGTVLSANLAAFFIFFELMLIASWLLIAIWGGSERERAALKYFVYTEAGALLLLAGIASTYAATGTLNILEIPSKAAGLPTSMIALIVSLMFVGFLVKMAIFPFHTWLPDAYTQAPMPITAIFSAMTGIGGYAAIRVLYTGFPQLLKAWNFGITLTVLAVITMIYGGYMALAQGELKRLLAYSSMSQMGYLLLAVGSQSIIGALGALRIYTADGFAKAILFMASGLFSKNLGSDKLDELGGLAGKMQLTSITFMVGFLSLMGFPPLLGFWGELFVFAGSVYTALSGSIDILRFLLTMVAILMAILTAGYGLWTIKRILFGEPSERVKAAKAEPMLMIIPMLISAILIAVLGIHPSLLTKLLAALSLSSA